MNLKEIASYNIYFNFLKPTWRQTFALVLAHKALFKEPFGDLENFFQKMSTIKFSEAHPTMLAAYDFMFCREMLPDALNPFLPKTIRYYSVSPEIILENNREKIQDYVNQTIAPDFDAELKGSFFKMGGASAKDVKITKADSLQSVVDAFCLSMRFRREALLRSLLGLPITLFFIERLSSCESAKEIRVMVKDSRIQGISAYHMQARIKYSENFIPAARALLEENILPFSEDWQADFVVDLTERKTGDCQIIEFNSYWTSFPCLYGEMANIGKPFIIEEDIYNANEILQKKTAAATRLTRKWLSKMKHPMM